MFSIKKNAPVAEKKNWYADRYEFVSIQRNFLAIITLISLLLAATATFSVSQLAPLKSVEPFVIQIDRKSGMTQVVNPVRARELTANEAVNQYFIVQYCRAHESYYIDSDRDYHNGNLVRVLSVPSVYSAYRQTASASNPDSAAARLGASGERQIHVESIKYFDHKKMPNGDDVMKYLIKAEIVETKNDQVRKMQKIIFIEFKYAELELTTEDRYLNPIGFQVVSYSIDDDNLTQ